MKARSMGDDLVELLQLERLLMDPGFRRNTEAVAQLLAPGFREFGASGREWTRMEILELLATEPEQEAPQITDFATQELADEAVLVTYRAHRPDTGVTTLRSSIWTRHDGRWQLIFHQATKTD